MATSQHIQQLIAAAKAKHAALRAEQESKQLTGQSPPAPNSLIVPATPMPTNNIFTDMAVASQTNKLVNSNLALNAEQALAVELGMQGKSFCLIGAAGTGKTTTTQELIKLIQRAAHMRPLADSTKHLNKDAPGFVIVGYTNKAVNNIRKRLPTNLQTHCLTIHKLVEFAPEYFTIVTDTGDERNTMRFTPSRNGANPLPHISTVIIEESSMVGTDLFGQLLDALPRPWATQFIFLGDIFQLPPVFGPSILGFKMSELPVVELTHVYRQALESPIISLATAIRTDSFTHWLGAASGKKKVTEALTANGTGTALESKVTIRPWKKRLPATSALITVAGLFTKLAEAGEYDVNSDQILCPFNKSFGTIELNKHIAQYLTTKRGVETVEVIARYQRSYWAVGDRVLVDRHEAVIRSIEPSIGYVGKPTAPASLTLNRWGDDSANPAPKTKTADEILNELDAIAEAEEDGKNLASHKITVYIDDLDEERILDNAGQINSMLLAYAITVHKSQGSEWKKVFIVLHGSHATMLSRELMYTAITRAREELFIICEGDIAPYQNQLLSAANRAVIPGVTLQEKIEYFKGAAEKIRTTRDNS